MKKPIQNSMFHSNNGKPILLIKKFKRGLLHAPPPPPPPNLTALPKEEGYFDISGVLLQLLKMCPKPGTGESPSWHMLKTFPPARPGPWLDYLAFLSDPKW